MEFFTFVVPPVLGLFFLLYIHDKVPDTLLITPEVEKWLMRIKKSYTYLLGIAGILIFISGIMLGVKFSHSSNWTCTYDSEIDANSTRKEIRSSYSKEWMCVIGKISNRLLPNIFSLENANQVNKNFWSYFFPISIFLFVSLIPLQFITFKDAPRKWVWIWSRTRLIGWLGWVCFAFCFGFSVIVLPIIFL